MNVRTEAVAKCDHEGQVNAAIRAGMSSDRMVRAVVFDMDGLLLDSETLAMQSLVSAGAVLGYDISNTFCRKMIGMPADANRELVATAYGPAFPLKEYFELHESHLRRLVDSGVLVAKSGARELLDELERRAIPKAIATSSSRERADHHLQLVGFADRFDAVITRQDVSHGKPHPEPYLTAVAALGADPAYTLAVEDSPNGLRAATAAGLRCILIPDLVAPTPETRQLAHRLFPDLFGVLDYLAETNPSVDRAHIPVN